MDTNKTILTFQKKKAKSKWYLIDAQNQILGRLSTKIAYLLNGKNLNNYVSYISNNIHIIVINSKEIQITGKKKDQKIYYRHSGQPGGLKKETLNELQNRNPNKIIEKAVKGMLPKNKLGRKIFTKLKVYPNDIHPHIAQKPQVINL